VPQVHRNGDSRICGASTIAVAHKNVFVNTQPISVNGDPNNHGSGNLSAQCRNVFVGGKLVVLNGNPAKPDNLCPIPGGPHCGPNASSGSPNVYIGA
tara:strand:- start:153 stop:443 length:291 start_codon:yes stop_codon:yes gene_type:complete